MTREEVHDLMENELRCVQRGNYCDRDCAKCPLVKEDKELIEAYGYVIKELEQQPCGDCIKKLVQEIPPVKPQKIGHWILKQRDKYIDISCSECGNTRFKDYAYGYTIDKLNLDETHDWFSKLQINYCECCSAKMQGVKR